MNANEIGNAVRTKALSFVIPIRAAERNLLSLDSLSLADGA
jgi:hypothetical protein